MIAIIQSTEPAKRHGKIIRIKAAGEYVIEDIAGRRFVAESDNIYKVGQRVVVRGTLITGVAGRAREPRRFSV